MGDILKGLAIEPGAFVECTPKTLATRLCVDSRRVESGCIFLALRGATVDAHGFVDQAFADGAKVALIERGAMPAPSGAHVWLADTNTAYAELAANAHGRPGDDMKLGGITGTNGKTTTAHLVGSLLAAADLRYCRLGTTGNWVVDREEHADFTTPFPLELQALLARARTRGGTHAVMEVSSHALEQGRARPLRYQAIGMTSFSQDHLDFHPTMAAYLVAKCRLANEHLRAHGTAVAAVDGQPAAQQFLAAAARTPGVHCWRASRGEHANAELLATDIEFASHQTTATLATPAGTFALCSPLIAPYNLDNVMVAVGIALGLGVPLSTIDTALRLATGAPGRLERIVHPSSKGPAVVVDYAHTPDAVERALAAVQAICSGKLHIVLGCGGDRDPSKRPLMGRVAAQGADVFWASSDNPRTEDPASIVDDMLAGVEGNAKAEVHREVDRASAIAAAVANADPDDLVLIAGKGHEDYQILGDQKIHFDDREHALLALQAR